MKNLGRKLEIFVIVVGIALVGIIYAFKQKPAAVPASRNSVSTEQTTPSTATSVKPDSADTTPVQSTVAAIEYPGQDGKSALQLLQISHQVGIKHYSYGDFVESIDGVKPDSQHFWALYVNDKFAQVGASS